MTLLRSVYLALKKLFRLCDHRWVEVQRNKVNGYYFHSSYISGVPDTVTIVIELKCSRCGNIKVKKIKL